MGGDGEEADGLRVTMPSDSSHSEHLTGVQRHELSVWRQMEEPSDKLTLE